MTKLNDYIDHCILDEYATYNPEDGCTIYLDDIPNHDLSNLIDHLMMQHDSFKETVLCAIEKVLEARIPDYEEKNLEQRGLYRIVDRNHGDVILRRAS